MVALSQHHEADKGQMLQKYKKVIFKICSYLFLQIQIEMNIFMDKNHEHIKILYVQVSQKYRNIHYNNIGKANCADSSMHTLSKEKRSKYCQF